MPEEEGEDEADAKAHEPGHEEERAALDVGKVLEHRHPLRDLTRRLGKHLRLQTDKHIIDNDLKLQ